MNNRPLTAVSSDSGDIDPLTPNHFLLGRAYSNVPLNQLYPSPATISKQWKVAQQLADYLWSRLQKEFYPSLNPRQKWTALSKTLQPGSIVWILQEFTPRGLWRLGRILAPVSNGEEVEFSKENQYRQYKLWTPRGELILPPIRLCALENSFQITKINYSKRDKRIILYNQSFETEIRNCSVLCFKFLT